MTTTVEASKRLYTVEEFLNLEWDEADDNEYALIGEQLVARPKGGVSGEHGDIVTRVASNLDRFAGVSAGEKRLGKVYSGASTNFGQPQGLNYAEPSVCFVLDGRTPEKFRGPIPAVPDIVVEVWSPSDTTQKIQDKIDAYQQVGVPIIWSIYMLSKFIVVYSVKAQSVKFLTLSDELDGEEVIPGFTLKVSALFE